MDQIWNLIIVIIWKLLVVLTFHGITIFSRYVFFFFLNFYFCFLVLDRSKWKLYTTGKKKKILRASFGESSSVLALLIHLNVVNENERVHFWDNADRSLNRIMTFMLIPINTRPRRRPGHPQKVHLEWIFAYLVLVLNN